MIDVRTPAEFGQGHLENAVNIDFYAPNFRERLDTLERDRTYVVYCKKGARGAKAMESNEAGRLLPGLQRLGRLRELVRPRHARAALARILHF